MACRFGTGNREHKNILEAMRVTIEGSPARFQDVPNHADRQPVRRIGFKKYRAERLNNGTNEKVQYKRTNDEIYIAASQLKECAPGYKAKQIRAALFAEGWIDSTSSNGESFDGEKIRCFKINNEVFDK